jgi:hypothetical protein
MATTEAGMPRYLSVLYQIPCICHPYSQGRVNRSVQAARSSQTPHQALLLFICMKGIWMVQGKGNNNSFSYLTFLYLHPAYLIEVKEAAKHKRSKTTRGGKLVSTRPNSVDAAPAQSLPRRGRLSAHAQKAQGGRGTHVHKERPRLWARLCLICPTLVPVGVSP